CRGQFQRASERAVVRRIQTQGGAAGGQVAIQIGAGWKRQRRRWRVALGQRQDDWRCRAGTHEGWPRLLEGERHRLTRERQALRWLHTARWRARPRRCTVALDPGGYETGIMIEHQCTGFRQHERRAAHYPTTACDEGRLRAGDHESVTDG